MLVLQFLSNNWLIINIFYLSICSRISTFSNFSYNANSNRFQSPEYIIKKVSFDTDSFEDNHNIITDYHTTSCFPAKRFYTVRCKRKVQNLYTNESAKNTNNLPRGSDVLKFLINSFLESQEYINTDDKIHENKSLAPLIQNKGFFRNVLGKCLHRNLMKISSNTVNCLQRSKSNESENRKASIDRDTSFSNEDINVFYDDKLTQSEHTVPEYKPLPSSWNGDKKKIREAQAKLMKQYMDTTVDPCDDFYQYSCGNWGKLNPIPKDKTTFDTFEMLRESLDLILRELLEEKVNEDDISAYVKAKNLYKSCINYEILEQRGDKPLIDLLKNLGYWPILTNEWDSSNFDWLELMAHLRLYNNDILISEWVGPDIKNSDEYIIQFDQTSLGLPTRDYYLQSSNLMYLNAYKNYMIKIATLLGASSESVKEQADEIIAFETSLARITSASDERRNVSGLYQRMTVGELKEYVPQVDWERYLTIVLNRTCSFNQQVVIFALRYVQDLVALLGKTSPRIISNYLLWRFVRHRVNNLDDRYQEAKQEFYYILVGREKAPPRWKYCVTQVNTNMGMAVGAMFVKKYFNENIRNDTIIMTKEIQKSFNEILESTKWISDETKNLAFDKVNSMMLKVGYPEDILKPKHLHEKYQDVEIHPDQYFENTLNILQHLTRVEQRHLGTAVNKSVWNTAPAVVNAYYSRNKNQIMIPAGLLQQPFYHKDFPPSLNFGGIGIVIGHEISHGFDDKGRLFDKHGNLHRWWKDDEIRRFHERTQCLIEQYSKYVVQEVGIPLDGINTQGENIADNAGIKQAYKAYSKWLSTHDDDDDELPGLNLTGNQLFFLNFGQVWCGNTRPEASKNGLKTAVHSPGKFRVIGTLSNSEDFSKVFKCAPGSPMNPVKKCSVW